LPVNREAGHALFVYRPNGRITPGFPDMHSRVWLALAVTATLVACGTLSTKPPRAANLTGDWKLDQALSEDPRGVMRAQHQSQGGGMRHGGWGGGMGGGGGGGMGGGMGGGGMPGGGGMHGGGMHGGHRSGGASQGGAGSGHGGPLSDFLTQPAAVSIKQTAHDLNLVADGSPTLYEYGEKVVASVQGGVAERNSGWKGDDFVVKYKVQEGPVATRSYEVADGGKQLLVTTHIEGDHMPKLEYRTVYDRATAQ
jgi:hypothetical protein